MQTITIDIKQQRRQDKIQKRADIKLRVTKKMV